MSSKSKKNYQLWGVFEIHTEVEDHPRGYPRLAALQNSDPVFAIFRRFGNLHARCLLLAQDELHALEAQLWDIDCADPVQLYLSSRAHDANDGRKVVLDRISVKLREYHQDLLRYCALTGCDRPNPRDVTSLQKWMDSVKPLVQAESGFSSHSHDLVTTPGQNVENGFLERVVEMVVEKTGFARSILQTQTDRAKTTDTDLHFYSTGRLRVVGRVIYTAAASLMIIIPVFLLYRFPSSQIRLSMIAVFTVVFAFALALATRARRHEIFVATATYAAVLVIFLGNVPTDVGN